MRTITRITAASLTAAMLITGCSLPETDTAKPGNNKPASSDSDGEKVAQAILEDTFATTFPTARSIRQFCNVWNKGGVQQTMLVDAYMDGLDGSNREIGLTNAQMRAVLIDFMDGECA